jgi:putative oxidoreductase
VWGPGSAPCTTDPGLLDSRNPNPARISSTGRRPAPAPDPLTRFAQWLAQHSITALRISLGLVIAGFGALKFIPGASPAEALVMQTTEASTFGVVSGTTAVVIHRRAGDVPRPDPADRAWVADRVGRDGGLARGHHGPVVLFPGEMFPGGFPTLAAQYVLKDLIPNGFVDRSPVVGRTVVEQAALADGLLRPLAGQRRTRWRQQRQLRPDPLRRDKESVPQVVNR